MDWDSFVVGFALGVFVALALVFEKWLRERKIYHFSVSADTGYISIKRHAPARRDDDDLTGGGCEQCD